MTLGAVIELSLTFSVMVCWERKLPDIEPNPEDVNIVDLFGQQLLC